MTTATYRRVTRGRLARMVALGLLALAATLLQSPEAQAQWSQPDAQGNISNTNTGNVGIGAMPYNPEGWAKVLDVYGSPHARFTIRTSMIDSRVMSHDGSWWGAPSGMFVGTRTAHPLTFGTANTHRMMIAANGNVGVGTTTPTERLDVRGNVVFEAGTNPFLFTGTGAAELNRYLYLVNAPGLTTASGLKAGGVLVSDDYGYANPAKNDLVVKGRIGIGTAAGSDYKLDVNGSIRVSGNINAKYQDLAEWVPSVEKLAPATVVILDVARDNHVAASSSSYDTRVAGVISAQPGISLGEAGEGKVLVATTGRVKVRVDATQGPIKVGDLLVTSDRQGYAMKSEPVLVGKRQMHAPGTIIGKALESLAGGTGEILVLLSLQ